jgi:hypothetical protein
VVVIDILPPTPRDPAGMHKAVWDEIEEEPFELPPGKPLTLAAYVAGDLFTGIETTAYVELIGVGDILPDMPAYLDRQNYVPVPLETAYQTAWGLARPICANWWKRESCPARRSECGGNGWEPEPVSRGVSADAEPGV